MNQEHINAVQNNPIASRIFVVDQTQPNHMFLYLSGGAIIGIIILIIIMIIVLVVLYFLFRATLGLILGAIVGFIIGIIYFVATIAAILFPPLLFVGVGMFGIGSAVNILLLFIASILTMIYGSKGHDSRLIWLGVIELFLTITIIAPAVIPALSTTALGLIAGYILMTSAAFTDLEDAKLIKNDAEISIDAQKTVAEIARRESIVNGTF